MRLKKLILRNFRSYDEFELEPEKLSISFVGPNGTGKTNILEAVYYSSHLKPARARSDAELVKTGKNSFFIKTEFQGKEGTGEIQIGFDAVKKKKEVLLNGIKVKLISDAVGKFKAVAFMSSDILLITGSPSLRRNFIDSALSLIKPEHRTNLISYRSTLKERNAWLKSVKEGSARTDDLWKERLINLGAKITASRIEFVAESRGDMVELFREAYGERLNIFYKSRLKRTPSKESEIAEALRKAFNEMEEKERILGSTLVGPHRDDLAILTQNGYPASEMLSQGQIRFLSLTLKAGVAKYIEKNTGEKPVLLIDDVLLEVDRQRKNVLVKALPDDTHTIFATTSKSEIPERFADCEIYEWINGKWERTNR